MKRSSKGSVGALVLLAVAILGLMAADIYRAVKSEPVKNTDQQFGSTYPVGGMTYYLYGSGVGSSDTSITLTSFKIPVSNQKLRMSDFGTVGYLTLEPGNTTRQEFVSFTGVTQNTDGTATLSGVSRGLSPITPFTASSTLQKQHAGGTQAVISNPPQLYNLFANRNNAESIYGVWTFSSTSPPVLDAVGAQSTGTYISTTSEFASIAYVNAISFSGTSNATAAVKGISELATAAEAGAGTTLGGTGASLVLPASLSTSTPTAAGCSSFCVVVATAGKIAQAFIDLTATYTWTALHTFAGGFTASGATTFTATSTVATSTASVNFKPQAYLIAGTAFTGNTTPQPIYVASTTGQALLSDGNAVDAEQFMGFAVTTASSGQQVLVQMNGVVSGFTGLTAGADYYVQDAVGTIGTSVGTAEIYVGTAISTTAIQMPIASNRSLQYLGSQSLTCNGDTVINQPLARHAVISGNASSAGGSASHEFTISKVGKTTGTWTDQINVGPAESDSLTGLWTSTSSIRMSKGSDATSCSGTAYYYR